MKPNPDYLKRLLTAFQDAPAPTTDIREIEAAGVPYNDPQFEFHMRLLNDHGYVERDDGRPGIGLSGSFDGKMWSVIPLRLTASGHEFAEALSNNKVFAAVKANLIGASIGTIKDFAVAFLRGEMSKHGIV
jgi:hypothetical protein